MSRQVTHDGNGGLEVRFAFDRSLVERIKGLPNRRWIATDRHWWVPDTDVVLLVEVVGDCGFAFCETTIELYRRMGGTAELAGTVRRQPAAGSPRQASLFGADEPDEAQATGAEPPCPDEFTVGQLNETVRGVLEGAFPDPVWLVGEISGFNKSRHKRIVGFHLVELEDDGRKAAEVSAVLFDTERQKIRRGLRRAGNPFKLEDEVRVRLKVRVDLFVPWGAYRVVVEDIDLNFTLGEAARRREEILRRLAAAGLIGVNSELPLPPLPLRLGLITSLGSDAYNDVLRTLMDSGFAFQVTAHGARVQGRQTEASVLNALDWFRERADRYDALLICRGGGSRTDLAWFDSEPLGRAVATFPLPVVVGIGHEQDHSVLDAVGRRAKTPTAAAALLVDEVRRRDEAVELLGRRITEAASQRLRRERVDAAERGRRLAFATRSVLRRAGDQLGDRRQRAARGARALVTTARLGLTRAATALPRAATVLLGRRDRELSATLRALVQGARRDLATARTGVARSASLVEPRAGRLLALRSERLAAAERRLRLSDPRRVVERGYSILRLHDGRVVTAADQAPAGAEVRAELKQGALRLRSEGVDTADPGNTG